MKDLKNLNTVDPTTKEFVASFGENMGNITLGLEMSINEFIDYTVVRNTNIESVLSAAQRVEREAHTGNIARHVLSGLMISQIKEDKGAGIDTVASENLLKDIMVSPYAVLAPFVCSIRGCERDGADLNYSYIFDANRFDPDDHSNEEWKKYLPIQLRNLVKIKLGKQTHLMSVVDGQHRRSAFIKVKNWLDDLCRDGQYPPDSHFKFSRDTLSKTSILSSEKLDFWLRVNERARNKAFLKIEVHLGLNVDEERQLFTDINLRGLKVSQGEAQAYDSSDPINTLINKGSLKNIIKLKHITKDVSVWHEDKGEILRKFINPITTLSMFGKISYKRVTPNEVDSKESIAKKYWEVVQKIKYLGVTNSRQKTVAAQPVVLKAIAKLQNDLAKLDDTSQLVKLYDWIENNKIDFSHKNKIWGSLMLDDATRKKNHPGIEDYVYVPVGTNLDAGTVDPNKGWIRYGSKHNDIFPRIADLIRFQLKLEPRKQRGLNI